MRSRGTHHETGLSGTFCDHGTSESYCIGKLSKKNWEDGIYIVRGE